MKLSLLSAFLLLLLGCQPRGHQASGSDSSDSSRIRELVVLHCGGCHETPNPRDLPTAVWRDHVLPHMAARLGMYAPTGRFSRDSMLGRGPERLLHQSIFPAKPLLSAEDWSELSTYFLENSPQSLPASRPLRQGPPLQATSHSVSLPLPAPATTMIQSLANGDWVIGEANLGQLLVLEPGSWKVKQTARVGEAASQVVEFRDGLLVNVMGSFSPKEGPTGFLLALPSQVQAPSKIWIDSLRRPVSFAVADLDQNGSMEWVVAEFGKWLGGLTLHQQDIPGKWISTPLWTEPGATQIDCRDVDDDGDLDLVVLFSQGREGIWCFRQMSPLAFQAEPWLSFPPSSGTTSFRWMDEDGDGKEELLVTMGDNADYPPVTKPYHGIYLFDNQDGQWVKRWHLPFPGAYQAEPVDFDLDGDLDLAVLSFFPDFSSVTPMSAGIMENIGPGDFVFRPFPRQEEGRWLRMALGDVDRDGDTDVLLGGLLMEVPGRPELVETWAARNHSFMWIENNRR